MVPPRRPTVPYTELGQGDQRRPSYLEQLTVVAHASARRGKQHLYIVAAVTVTLIFVLLHSTPDATRQQLQNLSLASLHRLQDAVIKGGGSISPEACPDAAVPVAGDDLGSGTSDYQYPKLLHTPSGYGSLSRKDNPWRERFLVPLYACNEQETGSQMHVRQLLHLAKELNRTLVLPNWGFGIPTISVCRPYAFDTIYETESTNSVGLWSVPYKTWMDYIDRKQRRSSLASRIAIIFFRDTHRRLSEDIANTDVGILENGCIPSEPFTFSEPPLYMATDDLTSMSTVVRTLRETESTSTLFVFFNHYSELRAPVPFDDPLLQARPKEWGLWTGEPWPQWNYSSQVDRMFDSAVAKLPDRYAALQWRMELIDPATLIKCSDMFAEAVISGMRNMGIDTIYVASDMPIGPDRKMSKSASFNPPEVAKAKESIDHLVYRLNEASFHVKTWNDIKPLDGEPTAITGLADGASGIFDKLVLGSAEHLWAANPYCADPTICASEVTMTEVSSRSQSRHRPTPITTQPGQSNERGHLLKGLRQPVSPGIVSPQMAAFQHQQNYIALLQQQQLLMQQSQMILQAQHSQQQAQEAEANLRAMRRRSANHPSQDSVMPRGITDEQAARFIEARKKMQQDAAQGPASARFGQTLVAREEDEESVRGNPLAASALARRKRQSLTLEGPQSSVVKADTAQRRAVSYGGQFIQSQHRRRSSSVSDQSAISDSRPVYTPPRLSPTLTDPPALILSKPGEAFPTTSNASSDDDVPSTPATTASPQPKVPARRFSVDTRNNASHAHTDSISSTQSSVAEDPARSIAPWLDGVSKAGASGLTEDGVPRRPSQAGSLAAALSGRRQRPASMGGPPPGMAPIETSHVGTLFAAQQQQRSVSDASALSPFATTFQPLPITPFTPDSFGPYGNAPSSARLQLQPANGTATPIRQPRGPAVEAELSTSNFATRLRKSAISRLNVGRISLGGVGP
ncbi:hypothetical protein P7C70_g7915, partial [Phenoliferia sp. Uapishka_3]